MAVGMAGLWQCNDCKTITFGRGLNSDEAADLKAGKELKPIEQVEAPGQ
jgi:hypothetical protein